MKELDLRFATALTSLRDAPQALADAIRRRDGISETPDSGDKLILTPHGTISRSRCIIFKTHNLSRLRI